MKAHRDRFHVVVEIGPYDLERFCGRWPASGLRDVVSVRALFEFDTGDLVDLEVFPHSAADDAEGGGAMSALLEDAQNFAAYRLGIDSLRRG